MSINKKLNEDFFETKQKYKKNRSDRKLTIKKVIRNLIITLILITISNLLNVQCKNRIENNKERRQQKSSFNLENDFAEFQTKMKEQDTLKIWINHSICTYQGYEKLEITKKNKRIKIKSEYKDNTYPEWKFIYEKILSENDTIWKFGNFLKQNKQRLKSDNKKYGMLQIKFKGNKIQFFTHGLNDLQKFMSEYFETMIKIYPENKENIYGYELIEMIDGNNKPIIETKMETNS